ncbi:Oidioi.mRNA.OKI2018_I69.PAR.g9285.t1.cds [Oikopleura dioica]|uniref:Oidioi.mRNA.OKI2018_I69.PAR.g9285.t1.cds n=1 Tax=Oikopleura dioica TaxID=34765 RepID=A0ABN7RNE3_OIKDI|nr:Oidioi.mRNA.OKI2018_I69.PAR.g9285.t1.cds [Oikopleura dioica]
MTEIFSKEELENAEDLPLELGDLRVEEKLETSNLSSISDDSILQNTQLLSSIRDLAGSFTASSRELRDQVAAISENVEFMRSSQRSDSDLNFDCILTHVLGELEKIKMLRKKVLSKAFVKEKYQSLKISLDNIESQVDSIRLFKSHEPEIIETVELELLDAQKIVMTMKDKWDLFQKFDRKYFHHLKWLTEVDLDILHHARMTEREKLEKTVETLTKEFLSRKAGLEELRILAGEVIGFVDDEEKMEVREQMENLQTLSEGIMETVSRLIKPPASDEEDISAFEHPPLYTSTPAAKKHSARSSTGSTEIRRTRPPRAIVLKSSDDEERDGFEWDDSDMLRDLEDSHVEDEEAPIPVISPLETAAAPLEKLIDDGRTKVDQVEYLNRCETPVFSKLDGFTNDYEQIVDKADESIEKVHKQLLYPSILDASWKDQAQALINKWEEVRVGASQRSNRLREKFEKAEMLLTDVNLAISWLKEHNLLELMHGGDKNSSRAEESLNVTDSEKTFRKFQQEISKLKTLALDTKEQKPMMESLVKKSANGDCESFWDEELKSKVENLNVQWRDFTKGIEVWKLKIETKIKKSKEYENVICRAEELVGELHKKTQDQYDSGEIVELADELQSLRSRVSNLEEIISELHAVEKVDDSPIDKTSESVDSSEPIRSSTPKKTGPQEKEAVYDGFDTLRIVKTICDKELEYTERKIEEHNNNHTEEIEEDIPELVLAPADPLYTSENAQEESPLFNFELECEPDNASPEDAEILKDDTSEQEAPLSTESQFQRRSKAKLLFYSMILSYPTYAYALPFLTFLYSLVHCQSEDPRNCPLERLRHPEITLTWPNGAPPL